MEDHEPNVLYKDNLRVSKFKLHIDDNYLVKYGDPIYEFKKEQDPWGFHQYFKLDKKNNIIYAILINFLI